MKVYDKNKESSYLNYWDNVNNLHDWEVLKKKPLNNFEQIGDLKINKGFVKSYNEKSDEGCFQQLMFNILTNCMNFTMVYQFYKK